MNIRRTITCWFPGLLATCLLLLPVAETWFRHILLCGHYEEPLGYRYFYSLRQIADTDHYVFLPQGHLMGLFHQALNLLLNLAGPPMSEQAARIEVFGYASAIFAHLLTGLAVAWACAYCAGAGPKLLVALLAVLPYFIPSTSGPNHLLEPDYISWIPALAVATFALVAQALRRPVGPWSLADTAAVAGLTAIALAMKVSLLVFPAAIGGVLLIVRERPFRSALMGALSLFLGIAGWLLILIIYFHGRFDHLLHFFRDQSLFLSSVGSKLTFANWWIGTLQKAVWPVKMCALLPLFLLTLGSMRRKRPTIALAGGLGLGAAGSLYVLYSRDNPVTWMEGICFLLFALISVLFALPVAQPRIGRMLVWAAVAALCVQVGIGQDHFSRYYLTYFADVTKAQRKAMKVLSKADDRIAFLIPDNSFRPLTIDSAIWKGGSNILGGQFGASPLVRSLFPHRDYFSGAKSAFDGKPLNLAGYTNLVFVIRKHLDSEDPQKQRQFMADYFSTPLDSWTLLARIDSVEEWFLVWKQTPTEPPTGEP